MSVRPKLAELSCALDSLSQDKVRYLCVELGVPPATLGNIDASHPRDALRCITEYLEALLASNESLSWERVIEVLTSSRLRQQALAAKIRGTHCSSTGRRLLSRQSSGSVFSSSEDEIPCTSGIDLPTLYPTPPRQYNSVDESRPQSVLLPSDTEASCTKSKLNNRHLAKKITSFKRKFRAIVISANVNLSQQMSPTEFDRFKIDLTTLPMMGKTHHFLQKQKKRIRKAKSVRKVFEILDPYWNHVDYALLEHIVVHYCDGRIKKQMKRYKRKLHKFEKATSVKQFTSAGVERARASPGYSAVCATMTLDGKDCSLYQARQVKDSIAERASLEPYVFLLQDLHASSVVVTIAFPSILRAHVEQALDRTFLLDIGIVPDSITYLSLPQSHTIHSRVPTFLGGRKMREQVPPLHFYNHVPIQSILADHLHC